MNTLTPLERVREAVGSQKAIADSLGLSQPTVHEWFKRGQPPADRCIAIEAMTGGTVRCEDLRPDLQWVRDEGGRVISYGVLVGGQSQQKAAA